MGFDAFLFDAGGVLVLPDPTIIGAVVAPYGGSADHEVHRRAHYLAMKAKSDAGHREAQWTTYERTYLEALGVTDDHVDHAAEMLDHMRTPHLWRYPIDDSRRTLAKLAANDVAMGVVSNASGQIEAELRRQQVCQVGDGVGAPMRTVIDSHVVGVAKPDPRIFEFALAHFAEFDRPRIAYVGDSVTMDIGGARAAGLHPILIDPFDDHPNGDFDRVAALSDLLR